MRILISICLLFVLVSCKKEASDCIESKVDEFKSTVLCSDGASVKEYNFHGKLVYVFAVGNCISDSGAGVYDSNCTYLGYLGGIAGSAKINGVDFYSNGKYKRTIWHN